MVASTQSVVHIVVIGVRGAVHDLGRGSDTLDHIREDAHPLLLAGRVGGLQGVAPALSVRHVEHEGAGRRFDAVRDHLVHPEALTRGPQDQLTQWVGSLQTVRGSLII